jgi:broad specificity phosphatase PhoE
MKPLYNNPESDILSGALAVIIRHGDPVSNGADSGLTQSSKKLAHSIGEQLFGESPDIKARIKTSPKQRSIDTTLLMTGLPDGSENIDEILDEIKYSRKGTIISFMLRRVPRLHQDRAKKLVEEIKNGSGEEPKVNFSHSGVIGAMKREIKKDTDLELKAYTNKNGKWVPEGRLHKLLYPLHTTKLGGIVIKRANQG